MFLTEPFVSTVTATTQEISELFQFLESMLRCSTHVFNWGSFTCHKAQQGERKDLRGRVWVLVGCYDSAYVSFEYPCCYDGVLNRVT